MHHPSFGRMRMEMMMLVCLFILLRIMHVTAQPGFISIDCGVLQNYTDKNTSIYYVPDVGFINTGVNMKARSEWKRLSTVRSFPDGARNCYIIKPINAGSKYLVRATFFYGNYDGSNTQPYVFELHLGVNLWKTINISDPNEMYQTEVITVATSDFLSVCLVNIDSGTPFISGLDIRKLDTAMYPIANTSTSLVLWSRYNLGYTKKQIYRYPDDPYDRIWSSFDGGAKWAGTSNVSKMDDDVQDPFKVPTAIMSTAAIPVDSKIMESSFSAIDDSENPFIIFHFSDFWLLSTTHSTNFYASSLPKPQVDPDPQPSSRSTTESRVFDIYIDGVVVKSNYRPPYLTTSSVSRPLDRSPRYQWAFNATAHSTLRPLLNALEVYGQMDHAQLPTVSSDVDAITSIMVEYDIKRNWIGDPCAPMKYSWDGLNCSYAPDPQRIISLDLSSMTLTGVVSSAFANLTALQYLDLSYNNLTGEIPVSLGSLSSLKVLNLTGNNFTKPIPTSLLKKSKTGLLLLRFDDNTELCGNATSCLPRDATTVAAPPPPPSLFPTRDKKKNSTPVIVILSVVPVILIVVMIVIGWRIKKLRGLPSKNNSFKGLCIDQIQFENRQFTYMQLAQISSNFVRVLGKGGFGFVYHGYLESGKQVAIKMRSQSSTQGTKEFLAEAQNLTKVRHRNLVSLVGYCMDEKYLALVYEYMAEGSLRDHLRGKIGHLRVLGWGERLRIAVQAAQGLEYLHKGCKPPIIHRDIKSNNILLGEDMEAKIADFGLSRALQSDDQTHVSTLAVMGTPGYVDPEYHNTLQLNEKSDVYSFGVVLLELITGQPPIIQGAVNVHIARYVAPKLARGELDGIVDERLQGEYDSNSLWKVLDLALRCTAQTSTQRPIMSEVVTQLKDSLALETAFRKSEDMSDEGFEMSQTSVIETGDSMPGHGPSAR